MVYWVGFSKVGIGEVLRERSYDSIVKARRYALNVLKSGSNGYAWASIHTSKYGRYHLEMIDSSGVLSRYDKSKDWFTEYKLNSDGTLGKRIR